MNKPAAPLVGQRIRRKEDLRFLTGEGRYIDDIRLPFMAHAVVLRSPHAHARIKSIRTKRAAAMPDVLAIYTAPDLEAAKVGTLPVGWIVRDKRKRIKASIHFPNQNSKCLIAD